MSEQIHENKMGTMPVGKLIATMSWPAILSMLIQALYNIVDSIFVSMISEEALSDTDVADRGGRRNRSGNQFSDFQKAGS